MTGEGVDTVLDTFVPGESVTVLAHVLDSAGLPIVGIDGQESPKLRITKYRPT